MLGEDIIKRLTTLDNTYHNILGKNKIDFCNVLNPYIDSSALIEIGDNPEMDFSYKDFDKLLDDFSEKLKEIKNDLEIYGYNQKTTLLYDFCGDGEYTQVKEFLKSYKVSPLVNQLTAMYSNDRAALKSIGFEMSVGGVFGCEKEDILLKLGVEYTDPLIRMIVCCMVLDMDTNIKSKTIKSIVTRKQHELGLSLTIPSSLGELIGQIGYNTLVYILDTDFLDKDQWPYKGNAINLISDRLRKFNFGINQLRKMQLINSNKFMGISINSAAAIQILKDTIENTLTGK